MKTIVETAIAPHTTPTNKTARWDGPAAMRDAPNNKSVLRYMSAWVESGADPDAKSSYKFPHHRPTSGSAAVIAGVNNGLARLSQANIPAADRAGVERHLRKHRRDAGLSEAMSSAEQIVVLKELREAGEIEDVNEAAHKLEELEAEWQEMHPVEIMLSGAISFSDLAAEEEVREQAEQVRMLTTQFQVLVSNIMFAGEVGDKPAALRNLTEEFIALVDEVFGGTEMEEQAAVELSEAEAIDVLEIFEEADGVEPAAPLMLNVAIIQPGWGNKRDNHYYSEAMLRKHAGVFEKAKMYTTDHKESERSERTEVSQILECPVDFTEAGAPIARVGVFDEVFAQKVRNRAELGVLNDLHCSIVASGQVKENFELNGRKGREVTAINEVWAVDWVTKAGAGGHALNILEGDVNTMLDEEQTVEEVEEATAVLREAEEEAQEENVEEAATVPALLESTEVAHILAESSLPDTARNRLAFANYVSAEEVQAAIAAEIDYIKSVTNSGKPPTAVGTGRTPQRTLEEVNAEKDKANQKWLGIGRNAQ